MESGKKFTSAKYKINLSLISLSLIPEDLDLRDSNIYFINSSISYFL